MATSNIDKSFIRNISLLDRALNEDAENCNYDPSKVVKTLIKSGFTSCFYFDVGWDLVADDEAIVLTSFSSNKKIINPIGKKIHFKDSAIRKIMETTLSDDFYSVSPDENHILPDKSRKLAEELLILDCYRVFIPIYLELDKLVGVLTCVYDGKKFKLNKKNKESLSILSSLLTKYITKSTEKKIDRSIDELRLSLNGVKEYSKDQLDLLLDKSIQLLREALDAQAASFFNYDWYQGILEKTNESIVSSVNPISSVPEQYRIGKYLTGLAWLNKSPRYILDFEEYRKDPTHSHDVDKKSLDFHDKHIGGVKTVLYQKLDSKHLKLMIRVFNRSDCNLPFLTSHMLLLKKLAYELSYIIDELIVQRRLADLQYLSTKALSHITDSNIAFSSSEDIILKERVEVVSYLCFNKTDKHLSHYHYMPEFNKAYNSRPSILSSESLFRIESEDIYIQPIDNISPSDWEESLLNYGINAVLVIPLHTELKYGFLLLNYNNNERNKVTNIKKEIPDSHLKTIKSILAILQTSVEAEESYVTSKAALRFISVIGHEVLGPVSVLTEAANTVGQNIEKSLRDILIENKKSILAVQRIIKDSEVNLNSLSGDVSYTMDMIKLLTDNSDNKQLTLKVTDLNLNQVMLEAIHEVKRSVKYYDLNDKSIPFTFDLKNEGKPLHNILGDAFFIRKAFVNILTNAVKYSLPPGDNNPIKIKILFIPQKSMNVIQIQNFGFSIEEHEKEDIFKAFHRGASRDFKNVKRGLGIGLYLARKILHSHEGSLFVESSTRKFSDPHRNPAEGWITTMEVRLPLKSNLKKQSASTRYLR